MPKLKIPDDKLPDEWKDKERVTVLYSPLRNRTVSPKDWETKVLAWKSLISLYCIHNMTYSFTLAFLRKEFTEDGRPPNCLGVVMEDLVKYHVLQLEDEFLYKVPQDWGNWAADLLLKRPLSWSYNAIRNTLSTVNIDPNVTYVHLEIIKQESQKLLAKIPEKFKNKLINFKDLLQFMQLEECNTKAVKLLLHHLFQEGQVAVTKLETEPDEDRAFLIKFGQSKDTSISEVDVGIYVLQQNEKLFTKHVEELEDEIANCIKEIKQHLIKGHKQLAKTYLKKKHEIEKTLARKVNALHNIQVLLERIRDVHSDADVWQSYKSALSAFNTTFSETGLTEDGVEDTMLKLGEVLDIHNDVQAAISRPVVDQSDDDDLEEELAKLVNSDNNSPNNTGNSEDLEKELGKLDINFPDVPTASPAKPEISMG